MSPTEVYDHSSGSYEQIGDPGWTSEDIKAAIPAFLDVYKHRPVADNFYGMGIMHLFASWFMVRALNPETIIESGVWKGQGTWLLKQAAPKARLFAIDPHPEAIEYRSDHAVYLDRDFSETKWKKLIKCPENCLLFFDDHQNALRRVKQARRMGFRHLIFEDNYPPGQGDCYSLKRAFAGAGFDPGLKFYGQKDKLVRNIKRLFNKRWAGIVPPNASDKKYLRKNLRIYYEFPPVVIAKKTRWGDAWEQNNYPGPPPLFDMNDESHLLQLFKEGASGYNWICYVQVG